MDIKQATVTLVMDSTEVAKALKPTLDLQFSNLGKLTNAKLEDVEMVLTFTKPTTEAGK